MKLSLVGGVRLNKGAVEAYLTQERKKYFLTSGQELSYIEEFFHFLREGKASKQIGKLQAVRGTTAKGLPTASFNFLGTRYALYQKEVNFCVLVVEFPAEARESYGGDMPYAMSGDEYPEDEYSYGDNG